MPDKESKWLVVWYDCCEDPDMDDEGSYAVRINGDIINKLYLDFKYVNFPYKGKVDEWKRQYWAGVGLPLDTSTSKLQDFYGDEKTIAELPDITEYVINTEISDVERKLRNNVARLKELKDSKEVL